MVLGALIAALLIGWILTRRHADHPAPMLPIDLFRRPLFALSAALTKAVVEELHLGVVHVITSWEPYALAVVGYASMTLNQMALNTGALAATIAASTAVDPLVSVLLGVTVFDESLSASPLATVLGAVALGAGLAAMVVLARAEAHAASSGAAAES